jgi:hypothetical protein
MLSLTLRNAYAPADDSSFYLLTRSDAAPFGGTFAGLPEGASITLGGGYSGTITYQANLEWLTGGKFDHGRKRCRRDPCDPRTGTSGAGGFLESSDDRLPAPAQWHQNLRMRGLLICCGNRCFKRFFIPSESDEVFAAEVMDEILLGGMLGSIDRRFPGTHGAVPSSGGNRNPRKQRTRPV